MRGAYSIYCIYSIYTHIHSLNKRPDIKTLTLYIPPPTRSLSLEKASLARWRTAGEKPAPSSPTKFTRRECSNPPPRTAAPSRRYPYANLIRDHINYQGLNTSAECRAVRSVPGYPHCKPYGFLLFPLFLFYCQRLPGPFESILISSLAVMRAGYELGYFTFNLSVI